MAVQGFTNTWNLGQEPVCTNRVTISSDPEEVKSIEMISGGGRGLEEDVIRDSLEVENIGALGQFLGAVVGVPGAEQGTAEEPEIGVFNKEAGITGLGKADLGALGIFLGDVLGIDLGMDLRAWHTRTWCRAWQRNSGIAVGRKTPACKGTESNLARTNGSELET